MAVVPMGCDGQDDRLFATVNKVSAYGSSKWWLSLAHCSVCGDYWMLAQDERIYDEYFLRRLAAPELRAICDANTWPDDFSTYERVLALGASLSRACRFLDQFSPALIWTVQDLINERPEISVREIGELLGVGIAHATALLSKASSSPLGV